MKEYILYDSAYVKLKSSKLCCKVVVKVVITLTGKEVKVSEWVVATRGHKGASVVLVKLYSFIMLHVGVCFVKSH